MNGLSGPHALAGAAGGGRDAVPLGMRALLRLRFA